MTPERWRQVEEVYQSAMDREPAARVAYLADVCKHDDELRREVESLLDLNDAAVLVDQPAWHAVGEMLDNDSYVAIGTQLGPYRIEGVLGTGGMGQVYRARDTRLDRLVAIKVSTEEFGERFRREARAVAALNHPNICTLYDVGPNYLVMELVEGPTLAERIREGSIPLEEALAIACQMTDAMEAAHEEGIVHRDLKPGNIMIKPDGAVKVLDFGLAKRRPIDRVSSAMPEDSPTISMAATEAGMILGTAAYMSPEQARGQPVDKRADIWAFGVVLYEMLSGQQLFEGATVTDTLAAVLTKEPDWNRVPFHTWRLLHGCLEKDPKRRLRDIADAWRLLDEPALPGKPAHNKLAWAVAGVLGLVAAVTVWEPWRATRPSDKPLVRLDVDLGSDVSLGSSFGADAIISPDGTRLVFVSAGRLFTRRLDQSRATELPGTERAFEPFFSPNGQWIGFFADSKLKKISVNGGSAIALCDATSFAKGGSWGEDGHIIASLSGGAPLSRIPSTGGPPTPVTEIDASRGERTHCWPQILPGGNAVLFTANTSPVSGFDDANIEAVTLRERRRKVIQRGGTYGRYLPSGHLIYVHRGALFAVPFDLDRLEVRGTPTRVLEPVGYSAQFGSAQIDCSSAGTLVYRSHVAGTGLVSVLWLDRAGKAQPLLAKPGDYAHPALSPDGQRLAMSVADGKGREIWVYNWQQNTSLKVTLDGGVNTHPTWTRDGRYIVFGTRSGIFWVRADGSEKPHRLTESDHTQYPGSFTADGTRLTFHSGVPWKDPELWTVPVESDGAGVRAGSPQLFLQSSYLREGAPVFSSDGRWLAYESNESGIVQIYVRAFPDKGGKELISSNGGRFPVWSRNTRELYFTTEGGQIMVAGYTVSDDSFIPGKPRIWSEKILADNSNNTFQGGNFDVALDGKRIVALVPVEGKDDPTTRNHLIFLENFVDELRRRVPSR